MLNRSLFSEMQRVGLIPKLSVAPDTSVWRGSGTVPKCTVTLFADIQKRADRTAHLIRLKPDPWGGEKRFIRKCLASEFRVAKLTKSGLMALEFRSPIEALKVLH